MKIWFKIWKDTHLLEAETVTDETEETRTHKIFQALDEACQRFDLSRPIWLDSNVSEFQKFSSARLGKDNFVEESHFDYLELQG